MAEVVWPVGRRGEEGGHGGPQLGHRPPSRLKAAVGVWALMTPAPAPGKGRAAPFLLHLRWDRVGDPKPMSPSVPDKGMDTAQVDWGL